jgi:outer membrane protein OmpA-like peptidoglycan-associated protein
MRAPVLVSLALLSACAAGGKLVTKQEVIRQDIEKARKSGAERCAPKELALAQANADFASHDISLGQAGQAEDHLKVAEDNVRRAVDYSKECGPKQVTIGQAAPVAVPVIEKLEPRDTDGDGIPDRLDKCPNEPGPPPDGCPKKYSLLIVKKDRIEIKQQVKYQTGKFKVLPASYALLNQVVQVLRDYPKMKVRIEGHTDNVGGETFNLKLSQKRAESVKTYLVGKGIAEDRLESVGYGLTRPIASNRTEKGRAQNRRTEFHIVSVDE